jgi:hypothetical protein
LSLSGGGVGGTAVVSLVRCSWSGEFFLVDATRRLAYDRLLRKTIATTHNEQGDNESSGEEVEEVEVE